MKTSEANVARETTVRLLTAKELSELYKKNGVIGDWILSEFGQQILEEMVKKEEAEECT